MKMLEAKLRLAAAKGKHSSTYKQLKALSAESLQSTPDDLFVDLSKLNPSLTEEIIAERRE